MAVIGRRTSDIEILVKDPLLVASYYSVEKTLFIWKSISQIMKNLSTFLGINFMKELLPFLLNDSYGFRTIRNGWGINIKFSTVRFVIDCLQFDLMPRNEVSTVLSVAVNFSYSFFYFLASNIRRWHSAVIFFKIKAEYHAPVCT